MVCAVFKKIRQTCQSIEASVSGCFVEDVVAVTLKSLMMSVVESVQEFLLRRLSGELREVSVFMHHI